MTEDDFYRYWRPVRERLSTDEYSGLAQTQASRKLAHLFGLEYPCKLHWKNIKLTDAMKQTLERLQMADSNFNTLIKIMEARRGQG